MFLLDCKTIKFSTIKHLNPNKKYWFKEAGSLHLHCKNLHTNEFTRISRKGHIK